MEAIAWGMTSRPYWIGVKPKPYLIEERQEKWHSAYSKTREEAAAYGGAERANTE